MPGPASSLFLFFIYLLEVAMIQSLVSTTDVPFSGTHKEMDHCCQHQI
jgi:hypothetical protein